MRYIVYRINIRTFSNDDQVWLYFKKRYGAGTITNPHKHRDYDDEDFLGSWTSSPTPEWNKLDAETDTAYLIESKKNIDEYAMARLVESFKP